MARIEFTVEGRDKMLPYDADKFFSCSKLLRERAATATRDGAQIIEMMLRPKLPYFDHDNLEAFIRMIGMHPIESRQLVLDDETMENLDLDTFARYCNVLVSYRCDPQLLAGLFPRVRNFWRSASRTAPEVDFCWRRYEKWIANPTRGGRLGVVSVKLVMAAIAVGNERKVRSEWEKAIFCSNETAQSPLNSNLHLDPPVHGMESLRLESKVSPSFIFSLAHQTRFAASGSGA
jgi:hypothetical protein